MGSRRDEHAGTWSPASDAVFQCLIDNSTDIVTIVGEDTSVLYVSPSVETVAGYKPDELLGAKGLSMVHPADVDTVSEKVGEVLSAPETSVRFEMRTRHKNGHWLWLETTLTNLLHEEDVRGLVVNQRDITERKIANDKLRQSEQQYRALARNFPNGAVILFDENLRYIVAEGSGLVAAGLRSEELEGRTIWEALDENMCALLEPHMQAAIEGRPSRFEIPHGHKIYEAHAQPVHNSDGEVLAGMLTTQDITEHVTSEMTLREAEARYRTLVEHVPAIVYIAGFGAKGPWHYVSPQVNSVLGYTPEEWTTEPVWYRRLHPEDRERVLWEEDKDFESGTDAAHTEYRLLAKDGHVVWVRDESVIVRDDEGNALFYRGVMFDVTERMQLEEQLTHQAFHDPLTKLPNRALFYDRVEHALARRDRHPGSLAVMFLDLDDFKNVNDAFGHSAGDELLIQVAANLRSSIRAGDTAARFGGDEFAVLLEEADANRTAEVARRILSTFDVPFKIGTRSIKVKASIGAVVGEDADEDVDGLIRNADLAMYSAKTEGKARFALFDPSVQAEIASQMRLKAELGSVDMDNDLVIHYQPIVSLMAGNVSGAEALLRWSHPERGLLGPDLFIELAEETGAIVEIGEWVLREACKQATKWAADQPAGAFSIHVNLSARQLQHASIVDQVARALGDSGLRPENLVLEITESTVLSDWRSVGSQIARLREQGVLVALDDFGTGYSSLSYLQRFPVDILKIDRSFIRALTRDREGFRLTRAIIHLADTLQLITVAEGIETADQLAELNSIGCPLGQGFYLAEPLLPDDLTALMNKTVALPS